MTSDNWYETFFAGINCEMWEKAGTPEWTSAEVVFLKDVLNLKPGDRVLDIPCGTGRHSLALAAEGFQMTCVDISDDFIQGLKNKVGDLPITILHENLLTVSLPGPFDAAFCLGNSFGYFPYPDMEIFVQKVSAQLKPGARWVINSGVIAESFLARFDKGRRYELPGLIMEISNDYDVETSCLIPTLTYTKDGKQEVHQFKHYIYTVAELIRLLKKFNLKTIELFGALDKTRYELGSQQLFLVCTRSN